AGAFLPASPFGCRLAAAARRRSDRRGSPDAHPDSHCRNSNTGPERPRFARRPVAGRVPGLVAAKPAAPPRVPAAGIRSRWIRIQPPEVPAIALERSPGVDFLGELRRVFETGRRERARLL